MAKKKRGRGIINKIIDHYPLTTTIGNYCGPQTNSAQLIRHGVEPVSVLDSACLEHDKTYLRTRDEDERTKADKKLLDAAWRRVTAPDTPLKERVEGAAVYALIKGKLLLGQGLKRKRKARRVGSAFYLKQYRRGAGKVAKLKCKKRNFLK